MPVLLEKDVLKVVLVKHERYQDLIVIVNAVYNFYRSLVLHQVFDRIEDVCVETLQRVLLSEMEKEILQISPGFRKPNAIYIHQVQNILYIVVQTIAKKNYVFVRNSYIFSFANSKYSFIHIFFIYFKIYRFNFLQIQFQILHNLAIYIVAYDNHRYDFFGRIQIDEINGLCF